MFLEPIKIIFPALSQNISLHDKFEIIDVPASKLVQEHLCLIILKGKQVISRNNQEIYFVVKWFAPIFLSCVNLLLLFENEGSVCPYSVKAVLKLL